MSIYAPFRFLVALGLALLIATVIASSTAHGMTLGNAVAHSTLGSPLRAAIPISTAPGEVLQAACFRVVPSGDGSAQTVTAQVSLERTASAFRLIVTTENAVSEPAIHFGIQAGCETMSRRDYVLLLAPQVAGVPAAAAMQATARESGQERLVPPPPGAQRNAGLTSAAYESRPPPASTPAVGTALERQRLAAATAPAAFHPIGTGARLSASPAEAQVAQTAVPPSILGGWGDAWTYLAASLAIAGVVALAALLMRHRNTPPPIPQWTRGGSYAGPRSLANLSVQPVTLFPPPATLSPLSYAEATTVQGTPSDSKPSAGAPSVAQGMAPRTRTKSMSPDISTIDTLLGEVDPDLDLVEERAVREAWAAARSDVERSAEKREADAAGDAILQAIEDAERDLLFSPPAPAQAAIDNSLDDELLHLPPRPDKRAA